MINQFEPMSRSMDIFRDLSALTIAGTETLIKRQLELAETLVARGSEQMWVAYEKVGSAQTPQEWSQAVQKGVSSAIETARDCVLETAKLEGESLHLMQEQATEMQKLLTNAWSGASSGAAGKPAEKRATK